VFDVKDFRTSEDREARDAAIWAERIALNEADFEQLPEVAARQATGARRQVSR
jgi:hypothetical protein